MFRPAMDIPISILDDAVAKPRSEFRIKDSMKVLFKERITNFKIELYPTRIVVEVFHNATNDTMVFHAAKPNSIVLHSAVEEHEEGDNRVYWENVEQRFLFVAMDHLKSILDDLTAETVIDVLEVSVFNDDSDVFKVNKELFFVTLEHHFHYLDDKKLNVGQFIMQYSGTLADEREFLTFLRNINFIGLKQMQLLPSDPGGSELCLQKAYELSQWRENMTTLTVKWPMWTNIPIERCFHFIIFELCVWHLELEDVKKIVQLAHHTSHFFYTILKCCTDDWKTEVYPYFENHFNNAYENELVDSERGFQVFLDNHVCAVDAVSEDSDSLIELSISSINLLSIDVNPERAYLKVLDGDMDIEDRYIPRGRSCRFLRKRQYAMGKLAYEHMLYKGKDNITVLIEKFQVVLNRLEVDAIVDEFHVSIGWMRDDGEKFKTQKDSFVAMLKSVLRWRKKLLKVNKLVIEYSGAGADEDIVMAILPWIELTGNKELHFRPHPLDNRKRKLVLRATVQGAKGKDVRSVLSLPQWKRAQRFVMCKPFFCTLPMDQWIHFPKCEIVLKSISRSDIEKLVERSLNTGTFLSCSIKTISPNMDPDVFALMNQHSFQLMDENRTFFVFGRIGGIDHYDELIID